MNNDSIGALWKTKSSKGLEYYTGKINDVEIVAFINTKKENENAPDITIKKKINFSDDDIKESEKKNEK